MTDQEINKLVAEKVMSFSMLHYGYNDEVTLCWKTKDPNEQGFVLPDYCNDLNAAFEAWDKFADEYTSVNFIRESPDSIRATIYVYNEELKNAQAESYAKALCLAILKAIKAI